MLTNDTTSENWKKILPVSLGGYLEETKAQKIPNPKSCSCPYLSKGRKPWMVGSLVKKAPIMLLGYCFQLQNNEPKNHGWIVSYMNGPRHNWTHKGLSVATLKPLKESLLQKEVFYLCPYIYIYKPLKESTSVSENPLHHQLKYSSYSLFSHGEWPLMYPSLLSPTKWFFSPPKLGLCGIKNEACMSCIILKKFTLWFGQK